MDTDFSNTTSSKWALRMCLFGISLLVLGAIGGVLFLKYRDPLPMSMISIDSNLTYGILTINNQSSLSVPSVFLPKKGLNTISYQANPFGQIDCQFQWPALRVVSGPCTIPSPSHINVAVQWFALPIARQAQAIAAITTLMTPFTRKYTLSNGGYVVTGIAANNVPIQQFMATSFDAQLQGIFTVQDTQPVITSAVPRVWSLSVRESDQWTYFDDAHTVLGQTIIPTLRWYPVYLSWQSDHFIPLISGHHGGPASQFARGSACEEEPPLLAPYQRVQVTEQAMQECFISVRIKNNNQPGIFSVRYGAMQPINSVAKSLLQSLHSL